MHPLVESPGVQTVHQGVMSLNRERQPQPLALGEDLAPRDARHGIGGQGDGMLDAGERYPGNAGHEQIIIAARLVLEEESGFDARDLRRGPRHVRAEVVGIGDAAKAEQLVCREHGEGRVHGLVFHHRRAPDALAEFREGVRRPRRDVGQREVERQLLRLQPGAQRRHLDVGAQAEVRQGHFPEQLEVLPAGPMLKVYDLQRLPPTQERCPHHASFRSTR